MKRSTKYILGAACAAAGTVWGAVGWHTSRRYLDPRRVRARQTGDRMAAYAQRKGPLFVTDQEWYSALPAREEVCITSRDRLTLRGSILPPAQPTHRWAVIVHGHEGVRSDMASYAHHYAGQGWNVLMPDLRCHGESEGKAITMGAKEKLDLLDWLELILQRDPQAQIVLHGLSMGAATCLMASGEVTPVGLKAIISDCAYSSFPRQSYDMFRKGRLPAAPLLLTSCLATRLWAGFCPFQANAVAQVRRSVTPTLFIHGTEDHFVSPDMLATLCDACAAPKEWLLIPGAGHADALYRDPELYWSRVDDFLARHMTEEE